jgi:glycosyltransferase involved in cell wall biosynthesis
MMNILILNYEYPPLGGGAGVISHHIAKELSDLGHRVVFITAWYEDLKQIEIIDGIEIIRLQSKRKVIYKSSPYEMLSWVRKSKIFLSEYLKNENFNICIANFTIPGGEVGRFIKNNFGIPYIIISHGHDIPWFFPRQMFFYHVFTYNWIKNICKKSSCVFVQSEAMQLNAERFLSKTKTPVIKIANGCNIERFIPDYSKRTKVFKILFAGRLVQQKDPMTFLKSISLLETFGFEFSVTVAGDGPYLKKMKSFVNNNGLSGKVVFTGWINMERIIEEYQSASLFVASSLQEGMSVAIMESISCGLFTLTTPVSENTRLISIGVNGDLFDSGNFISLAEKIKDFYYNKFLEGYKIPDEIIKNFKYTYNWAGVVGEYNKEILNIVK